MWSEILVGYGIFILEILTLFVVIAAITAFIISARRHRANEQGELVIMDLSAHLQDTVKQLRDFQLSEEELKQQEKAEKGKNTMSNKKRKNKNIRH